MNIIAGERKGTVLAAPQGQNTRPTQAKVRESLFNMLQGYVDNSIVLDLFSGSGALALEALSRGAEKAVCVDNSHEAAKVIAQNIAKLRYTESCHLIHADFRQALHSLSESKILFDLVFLDPPYRMDVYSECCETLAERKLLNGGAILVLEHSGVYQPISSKHFSLFKEREYGDTQIHLYHFSI